MPYQSSIRTSKPPIYHHLQSVEMNKSPLQQRCRELLKEAKVDADPGFPYLVQLLVWGFEKVGAPGAKAVAQLSSMAVMLLYNDNPEKVMKFFLSPTNPEELQDQANGILDELKGLSPEEAWGVLQEQLHSAMSAQVEGYPPGSE